jgi:hypothetical protein
MEPFPRGNRGTDKNHINHDISSGFFKPGYGEVQEEPVYYLPKNNNNHEEHAYANKKVIPVRLKT